MSVSRWVKSSEQTCTKVQQIRIDLFMGKWRIYTHLALEWLLAGVPALMHTHLARCAESLVTVITFMRQLASVNHFMDAHSTHGGEGFIAYLALILL